MTIDLVRLWKCRLSSTVNHDYIDRERCALLGIQIAMQGEMIGHVVTVIQRVIEILIVLVGFASP